MKVAIYGAGAMGTVLGAYMANAGVQVDLVTRNAAHVRAMNQNGITVGGTASFKAAATAYLPEDMGDDYDVVILAAKQLDNRPIALFLKDKIKPDGVLCTIQNGLPEYILAEVLGENRVLGCACSWGATLKAPGEVVMTSDPSANEFLLGSPFENKADMTRVKALLSTMGKVVTDDNFIGLRWTKLIINSTFSPLSGMTGFTFGEIASRKETRKIAQEVFNECSRVCRAAGVKPGKIQGKNAVGLLSYRSRLKKFISSMLFPVAMKKHGKIMAGMYYDLLAGKPCEINQMSGLISEFGRKYDVKTPFSDKAGEIILSIQRGERKIDPDNILLFNDLL